MSAIKILATLGITAGLLSTPATAAEDILVRLSWIKTSPHMGIFTYAKQVGYFDQEGLNVTIQEGKGSAMSTRLIGAGDGFIGVSDLGTAMKGIATGIPVRAVYADYQQNPMAVISLASKQIKTPADLVGKRIVTLADGSYTKMFPVLCKKNNVDCTKVNLLFANPPFQTYVYSDRADAFLALFLDNVPPMELAGHKVNVLRYDAHGVDLLSNGLIVRQDTLTKRGETVKKFLRAAARAWKDAREKPDAVVDAWMKVMEQGDRRLYHSIVTNSASLLHSKHTKDKPLGWMAAEDWKATQDILTSVGELEKPLPIERYYTNEFNPGIK